MLSIFTTFSLRVPRKAEMQAPISKGPTQALYIVASPDRGFESDVLIDRVIEFEIERPVGTFLFRKLRLSPNLTS